LLDTLMKVITELSAESLSFIRGRAIVLYRSGEEQQPMSGWSTTEQISPFPVYSIEDSAEERPVAALDSSVIILGEVDDGFVLSGKVSVVLRRRGRESATIFGPTVFYIGERNLGRVQNILAKGIIAKLILHDHSVAARLFRSFLERHVSYELSKLIEHGILLLDGSLKESAFEPKEFSIHELVRNCQERDTYLAAVTKNTKIRQLQRLEKFLYSSDCPSYMETTDFVKALVPKLGGRCYLVRFASDGIPLRVDIPSAMEPASVLPAIRASDVISHGYPDTLRSAHMLSVFTSTEEASAKSRIARIEGTMVLPSFNVRRVLLGKLERGR